MVAIFLPTVITFAVVTLFVVGRSILRILCVQDLSGAPHGRFVFASVFALTASLLFFIVLESATGVVVNIAEEEHTTRFQLWLAVVDICALVLGVVLPLQIISSLFVDYYKKKSSRSSVVSLVGFVSSVVGLSLVAYLFGLFPMLVHGVSYCGVLLLALLTSYGAVNTPYVYLFPVVYNILLMRRKKQQYQRALPLTMLEEDEDDNGNNSNSSSGYDQKVALLNRSQAHTLETILQKERTLALLRLSSLSSSVSNSSASSVSNGGGGGFLRGFVGTIQRAKTALTQPSTLSLQKEIDTYHNVLTSLFLQTHEAADQSDARTTSRTIKGRLFTTFGAALGVYCVVKFFLSSLNIVLRRAAREDPVTRFASVLSTVVPSFLIPFETIIPRLSFLFLSCVVAMSLRGIFLSILKATSLSWRLSLTTTSYILSQLIGTYLFGSALMMRSALPQTRREIMSAAFEGMTTEDFTMLQWTFDSCFVIGVIAFALLHFVMVKLRISNDEF
eukprot:PhM_4_TR1045/c0_g1_i1/m.11003/K22193/GPR89, GPHR; golgi pH regulator